LNKFFKPLKQISSEDSRFFLILLLTVYYLISNSGIHSDEYSVIKNFQEISLKDFLKIIPSERFMITNFISYYLFWWVYWISSFENLWIYDSIKIFAHLISFLFVYKFSTDYLPKERSALLALIFLFYPIHESSTFIYMNIPYILAPSLLMYAHYLIRRNKIFLGIITSFLGTFSYYVSPPYSFGLGIIFLVERQFKKAFIFLLPGIIYLVFYLLFFLYFQDYERKIDSALSLGELIKYFCLQIISLLESIAGPSYFLKIFYSLSSLSLLSCLLALPIIWFLLTRKNIYSDSPKFPISLFYGFLSITILSCFMFSLTGLNFHSPFNLGNRALIYGSLLFSLFIVVIRINRIYVLFITILFILPTFGLSDHWKLWNSKQKEIILEINTHNDLKTLIPGELILVKGNLYNKLGPFSHIEFFSMPWHLESVFKTKDKDILAVSSSSYKDYSNNSIIDKKFNIVYELKGNTYLYDSVNHTLRQVTSSEVKHILSEEEPVIRHWVQLFKGTSLEETLITFSPRIAYIFD